MEKEVTEVKTRKEDTNKGQRGREQFEEGERLSWSESSGLCLLSCRQTVAESQGMTLCEEA